MNASDSKENIKSSYKAEEVINKPVKKASDIIKNKEELGKLEDFVNKNKKKRLI